MKRLIRHILAFVFLLTSFCICHSQEVVRTKMDEDISRYESLCEICLDLRTRIRQGEDVSRSEAQAFINRFLSMNKALKAKEVDMTAVQRRRFVSIGQWFSNGVKPELPLPVEIVEQLVYDGRVEALSTNDGPMIPDAVPVVDVTDPYGPDNEIVLIAELSVPSMSYGIRAGLLGAKFGGYASFRSDFSPDEYSYTCMSDESLQGGGVFWYGGESRSSSMAVHGGLLVRTTPWLTAYVGAGYGRTSQMWQDIGGKWAQVSDISFQGLSAEAGAILTWKMLAFSAGLSTVSFKTVSFTFGLGVRF